MVWKFVIILILFPVAYFYMTFHQNPKQLVQSTSSFIARTPKLNQIFSDNHSWIASLPKERVRTLIATGDIIPARSVNFQTTQRKDFRWPYLKTADVLKKADITFINLETPLITDCPITQEGMIFCGSSGNVEGLVYAGVDIANLANNHASNYGQEALNKTRELLNINGILVTGEDKAEVIDVRGIKFAFLGFNDIGVPVSEDKIKSEIVGVRKSADVVVATFHWGVEYRNQPDDRQKYLAHVAVDAGADLIIGNHPHWIQPVEIYKDKLITYAHGNFIFDQEWSLKTKLGVVGKYTFYNEQLIDAEYFPVLIENYGQPHFLIGDEKKKILEDMKSQSDKLFSF